MTMSRDSEETLMLRSAGIATLTLNRPERRNAMSEGLLNRPPG